MEDWVWIISPKAMGFDLLPEEKGQKEILLILWILSTKGFLKQNPFIIKSVVLRAIPWLKQEVQKLLIGPSIGL